MRPPLPPIYFPEKAHPMRDLSCGSSRLGRHGIASQTLKGSTPHPLWLDRDRQRKGSLLWPAHSRAELVGASACSSPRILPLTLIGKTVAVPTAEYAFAEIEH
jgi:hypothetical protein